MQGFLEFIFGTVDMEVITPISFVCIYTFALLMETLGSIFESTMKGGGLK